jgi:hypothetical protein
LDVYIEEFLLYAKVRYYTVKLGNQEDSETDRFINRFIASGEFRDELGTIRYWLEQIGTHRGATQADTDELFRTKKGKVRALPPPFEFGNRLRLYGIICSDDIVILGGGGRKTTKKAQDGDTAEAFELIQQVAKAVQEALRRGTIALAPRQLTGGFHRLVLP